MHDGAIARVGELKLRLNVVVLVNAPLVPVTVTFEVPAAMELLVLIVKVDVHVGLQLEDEKEAVVPAGKPEMSNETGCIAPVIKKALSVFVTEPPEVAALSPEFVKEKSKGWVTVKALLVTVLELNPALKALAFTVVELRTVMVPVYWVDN